MDPCIQRAEAGGGEADGHHHHPPCGGQSARLTEARPHGEKGKGVSGAQNTRLWRVWIYVCGCPYRTETLPDAGANLIRSMRVYLSSGRGSGDAQGITAAHDWHP